MRDSSEPQPRFDSQFPRPLFRHFFFVKLLLHELHASAQRSVR